MQVFNLLRSVWMEPMAADMCRPALSSRQLRRKPAHDPISLYIWGVLCSVVC